MAPEPDDPHGRIIRHEARDRPLEPAAGDLDVALAVEQHVARHLGEPAWVWHELVSDMVHLDVHVIEPTEERPHRILFTTGMSERPMHPPPGEADATRAELLIGLPADRPLEQEAFADERHFWPIRLLKDLARLPHAYETWLWHGHTVPNGDPPEPYAPDTGLCGALLLPPLGLPEDVWVLERPGAEDVHLFAVRPLHAEEMDLKLRGSVEALYDPFDEAGVSYVLDARRPSAVRPRRRRFGLV